MTDQELKTALTEWVKDYCKNDFLINNPDYDSEDEESEKYIESLPGGVKTFLNQGVDFIKNQSGIKSESLGDYSIAWTTDYPESLLKLIRPYKSIFPKRNAPTEWRVMK